VRRANELFATVLRELDRPGTLTVLAIEDIQWADESTLDLLRFLGRRVRDVSVLIIATYRDGQPGAGDPLRIVLGDLATQRTTRRVSVAPLSEQAVAELAVDSGIEPGELFRLTGGNPFFVTEVGAVGLRPDSAVRARRRAPRVAQLSDAARDAVQVAALIGTQVDARLLDAVCGASPSALDELVSSGILVSDAGSLRFRHEITRLAVEQEVPAHRRQPIHGSILGRASWPLVARTTPDWPTTPRVPTTVTGRSRARPGPAHRAVDLASHREAAAQVPTGIALRQWSGRRRSADLYDRFAFEASMIDRFQDVADARQRRCCCGGRSAIGAGEGATLRAAVEHHVATVPRRGVQRVHEGRDCRPRAARAVGRAGLGLHERRRRVRGRRRFRRRASSPRGGPRRSPPSCTCPRLLADALNAEGSVLRLRGR